MHKKKWIVFAVIVLLTVCIVTTAFAKYGLSKDEIRTIQKKLKNWGYYNG